MKSGNCQIALFCFTSRLWRTGTRTFQRTTWKISNSVCWNNMQVCNLTTPAQYFSSFKRQIKSAMKNSVSNYDSEKACSDYRKQNLQRKNFWVEKFEEVLWWWDNPKASKYWPFNIGPSGKVYYDLLKFKSENKISNTAILRLEQFYPYPFKEKLEYYNRSTLRLKK